MDAAFNLPKPLSFSIPLLHVKKLRPRAGEDRDGRATQTLTLAPKEGFGGPWEGGRRKEGFLHDLMSGYNTLCDGASFFLCLIL